MFARFRPSDATSVFGICSNQSSGGLAAFINGSDGKLQLYSWAGGSTPGTLIAESILPASLVAGRPYSLDIVKNGMNIVVKYIDNTTLQTVSITSTSIAAQLHGRAGIMQIVGAPVLVESFDHLVLYNKRVRAVLLGDSNLEGTALIAGQKSWGYQLAAMRSENDIVVAGRAGDTTSNFMVQRRVTDLKSWEAARYVLIALGTNDTNHESWRTNITAMIADCLLIGAEPILCTMPPRPSDQAVKSLMNADIRGHHFGRYRYIDFATALSLNQDSVTWDALLQTGDNTHSNIAGQQRMVAQVLADLPLLVA